MGDFAHALVGAQFVDDGHGAVVEDLLVDVVVGVGEGGDLRQVGDDDDLVVGGEHPQLFADDLPAAPADTGVDFVEDERGRGVCPGENGFQREHQA